jgi:hypothetical protein
MTGRVPPGWLRIWLLCSARFVVALAVFAAAELISTRVLSSADRMPLWLVLVATAVVALLFWLMRDPLDRLVDRVLLGERAGGYEAGRLLLQRMSSTLSVDEIVPALAETAGRTMHSTRAEVRLLLSDGDPWSQVWPARAVADGSPVLVGVRHAGTAVGEIEVDITDPDESDRDRKLLDDLARPAGLALSTVRLTVELRRRAVELEAINAALGLSYRRIAEARRTEIARMRTELQDRVMPSLDRAESAINSDPGRIEQARSDVADALESLRILARGIYPPRLADAGIAVSLEGWQQRSGIAVDVQFRGDEAALRANAELESCLYFCLVTALGALKPGGGRPTAVIDVGEVEVGIVVRGPAEDGSVVGGPAMMAVRDRVEAFGGRADIVARDSRDSRDSRDVADGGRAGGVVAGDWEVTVHAWIPLVAQQAELVAGAPIAPSAVAPSAGAGAGAERR